MTPQRPNRGGSAVWPLTFRVAYGLLRVIDPLVRAIWRANLPGLGSSVDVVVPGRRTGRLRGTLLTLLTVDGTWYVGHPNGQSGWTRNLEAAGAATLRAQDGTWHEVSAIRLNVGPERSRVISLTPALQPFPGNILYALAQRHIHAVGVYFRLEDRSARGTSPA